MATAGEPSPEVWTGLVGTEGSLSAVLSSSSVFAFLDLDLRLRRTDDDLDDDDPASEPSSEEESFSRSRSSLRACFAYLRWIEVYDERSGQPQVGTTKLSR